MWERLGWGWGMGEGGVRVCEGCWVVVSVVCCGCICACPTSNRSKHHGGQRNSSEYSHTHTFALISSRKQKFPLLKKHTVEVKTIGGKQGKERRGNNKRVRDIGGEINVLSKE